MPCMRDAEVAFISGLLGCSHFASLSDRAAGAQPILFAEGCRSVLSLSFPVAVNRSDRSRIFIPEAAVGDACASPVGCLRPVFVGRLSIILWITIENPSIICE